MSENLRGICIKVYGNWTTGLTVSCIKDFYAHPQKEGGMEEARPSMVDSSKDWKRVPEKMKDDMYPV